MTRRRQEKRSEKVEERRIREVEWKTDMKEEQEARRAGMAFENNYTFDPVGAKNVEVGDGLGRLGRGLQEVMRRLQVVWSRPEAVRRRMT